MVTKAIIEVLECLALDRGFFLTAVQSGRKKDLDFFLRLVVTFVGSPILILQLAVFLDGKEGAVYLNAGFHIAAKFQKEFGIKGRKARETISMKLMRLIMHKCLIFGTKMISGITDLRNNL